MNRSDEVLFRSPGRKLWKARALPTFLLSAGVFLVAWSSFLFVTGETGEIGMLALLSAAMASGSVGYFGTFVLTNHLSLTAAHVAPPSKPLSRPTMRRLTLPWRQVVAIEEVRRLYTGPDGVNYAFSLRTKDGRRYPFKALYVAWQTESTAEIRRVYEMVRAIKEAIEKGSVERLDQDPELMARLREIQEASYPEHDVFSRTLASKLAMIVGGPMFLAGLILVLAPLEGQAIVEAVSRFLWIVGGLIFLLGLSTKRAFARWGRGPRSLGS